MSTTHKVYIGILTLIVLTTILFLGYSGYAYYKLPLEERFFHPDYAFLKPGGIGGHGLGIIGTLAIILGIVLYMIRKRVRLFSRFGILKYWLEFHIFLCTIGPVLVLFHTSFKFGGIVAVSFWSMVAVFLSGIIGRFIYIQIPRTIEGRELSLSEIQDMKNSTGKMLAENYHLDKESYEVILESTRKKTELYHPNFLVRFARKQINNRKMLREVRMAVRRNNLPHAERNKIMKLVKHDISLNRRIDRLTMMQNLFKHWHVAHLPFAIVMLVIMVIHVAVTITFGYRWIF